MMETSPLALLETFPIFALSKVTIMMGLLVTFILKHNDNGAGSSLGCLYVN